MAQVQGSNEARDARPPPPPTNAPPPLPSRPILPTIAVPPGDTGPSVANNNNNNPPAPEQPQTPSSPPASRSRRGSFSFLRRSKSRGEFSEAKKESAQPRKLSRRRKDRSVSKEEAGTQLKMPPQLPSYHNLPQMNTPFVEGSATNNPSSVPIRNGHSVPPSNTLERPASKSGYDPHAFYRKHLGMADRVTPSRDVTPTAAGSSPPSAYQDPHGRTESMTNRGRYSYASSGVNGNVNSPRRVRRRKDPTPFNVLVVGSKSAGKTSFVEFLQQALTRKSRARSTASVSSPTTVTKKEQGSLFTSHYLESEVEGERIGVTLYDSNGLEKHLIDLQLREFSYFLESKFQETFREEQKVMRSAGVRDPHIHCVFLVLDPARLDHNITSTSRPNSKNGDVINKPRVVGGLDQDLDVDLLKALQGKTTVIPVISKADTVTTVHMAYLKRIVWDSLKKLKIDPLEILHLDSDDEGNDNEPASSALKEDVNGADTNNKLDEQAHPAASTSSIYDSALEGDEDDSGNDTDSTINKGGNKTKQNGDINSTGFTNDTLKPQHDEIRLSMMSENVDLPVVPLSIISPDIHDPSVIGRRFPWGFADPYNADHCDFTRLMENVFGEWREDLREAARERWYEGWRTNRLRTRGNVYSSPTNGTRATSSGQGRTVSGATAYGGKGLDSGLQPPQSASGVSSTTASRTVSATDIGVAVSSNGAPPPLPTSMSMPNHPKSTYRGVGTY